MPRKYKLTWQPGSGHRSGRWRKKYKGKSYYFDGGRGKSDREAYGAAWEAWEALKRKLDAAAPRPYQLDHELAIAEWEQVLAWSNRHGDQGMADVAFKQLETLRRRLEAPALKPLDRSARFESLFEVPTISLPEDLFEKAAADLAAGTVRFSSVPEMTPDQAAEIASEMDGSPTRIAREVWRDRLKTQQRRAALQDDALHAHVDRYVQQKEKQAKVGKLSTARVYAIRLHLGYFRDWFGRDTSITEIDGNRLLDYQSHLLDNEEKKDWSAATAKSYLETVKSFVRWLWRVEAISSLPRVLEGKGGPLNIEVSTASVVVYTPDEVRRLIQAASDRTKLYILLMLNCGMTQKDVSDLKVEEVDWEQGRIVRKRSKTSGRKGVPTVDYLLWPETLHLLRQERGTGTNGRALENANGTALCTGAFGADGKYKKTDNVKNAFDRLRKKLKMTKPLKSLKKTSATLVRNEERYQGLEGLFLGHAPRSMSDKHYTQAPTQLLDKAILWLAEQYDIRSCVGGGGAGDN